MTLYVCLIGIDGSGKSSLAPLLASLLTAELGVTAVAVSRDVWGYTPTEDLFCPGFMPEGTPLSLRLARWFQRAAHLANAYRSVYPPLKLGQMAFQERTVQTLIKRYQPEVIIGDGNLLLSAGGRAINYTRANFNGDAADFIDALHGYVFGERPLPSQLRGAIPGLVLMRPLYQLDRRLKLNLLRLPDALIFLDVDPETALSRLRRAGKGLDNHENQRDLRLAQNTYRAVITFFQQRVGMEKTAVIDTTRLSIDQVLAQATTFLRSLLPVRRPCSKPVGRLGKTAASSPGAWGMVRKALNRRYLFRYLLLNLHRHSFRELTFPFSTLGRLSLREGYSANVMRAIYWQQSLAYGWLDRLFLNYPLHQAVYHRLRILNIIVESELRQRISELPEGEQLRVLTAPSGYAFDLFQPLQRLAKAGWSGCRRLHIVASDLDPWGEVQPELVRQARLTGASLTFMRNDMTTAVVRACMSQAGPYDLVLFVGFSGWINKKHLLDHLRFVRHTLLKPGGVLVSDCFTPDAYALSGHYTGYQMNYYSPETFTRLLAYAGFDPQYTAWTTGPTGINHVCISRTILHSG